MRGRPCSLLHQEPISAGPQPCRERVGGAWKGKSCRAWLWAGPGLACLAQLQETSVVFHNQQAHSPGHVLLSPLAPHIPLHIQAAKWHSGLCWGWKPRHTQRLTDTGSATNTQTQRDNAHPGRVKVLRHEQHPQMQYTHPTRATTIHSHRHMCIRASQRYSFCADTQAHA